MPRHSDRSILIDALLELVVKQSLTITTLLSPGGQRQLNKPAKDWLAKMNKSRQRQSLRAALRYMKYNQLILTSKDGFLSVTSKAKLRLERVHFEHIIITKPKKWDKMWRLVLFDIPEKDKTKRDAFYKKMKRLGFYKLQNSVLVYPFPCLEQVEAISDYYDIAKHVTYAEVSLINNSAKLQRQFWPLIS